VATEEQRCVLSVGAGACGLNAVPDHEHSISADGVHTHTVTVSTLPPYYALAFIMKL
jgi:hypothetical protein